MKITTDIDRTPEEARAFLALPAVRPMQEQRLKDVQDRMTSTLRAMDPETVLKTWLPASLKGVEQWQEMFLSKMGGAQPRDK